MIKKINISIPKPCKENWLEMNPVEKARFCNLCQKNVFDFTNATDREIIAAYNRDQNLCGRFNATQLDRELAISKEKSSIWMATTSAIISFLGMGTYETLAQESIKIEQTDNKVLNEKNQNNKQNIEGKIIIDYENPSFEDVEILLFKENKLYRPNKNGDFCFTANIDDHVIFSKDGYDNRDFKVSELPKFCYIELGPDTCKVSSVGGISAITSFPKKRTFFGRIFHSIGNWFK